MKDYNELLAERDALADQLATLEADVLQREAQLILTAKKDPSAMMSRQTIGTLEKIAAAMKTRAALIRVRAQEARAREGE